MNSPIPTTFNSLDKSFLTKYQVAVPSKSPERFSPSLTQDYEVGPNDVVCGRGKGSYNRPGNKRFRELVQGYVKEYVRSRTKLDKTMLLAKIVDRVNEHGRFIKKGKKGHWCEIDEEQARDKVGHAMREAIKEGTTTTPNSKPKSKVSSSSLAEVNRRPSFQKTHTHLASSQIAIFEELIARAKAVYS